MTSLLIGWNALNNSLLLWFHFFVWLYFRLSIQQHAESPLLYPLFQSTPLCQSTMQLSTFFVACAHIRAFIDSCNLPWLLRFLQLFCLPDLPRSLRAALHTKPLSACQSGDCKRLYYSRVSPRKILTSVNGTNSAFSTTMAGHTSESIVSVTSETNANQESGTIGTTELRPQNSLQDDFSPATALDFGLDLDYLDSHPVFGTDPDFIEWESCSFSAADDNTPEASQELNDFDDVHSDEEPLAQTQFCEAQEPNSAPQEYTVDPAELFAPAIEDSSDLLGISDLYDYDLNGFLVGDFELPDNPSGLDFLQGLHLIGMGTPPVMSPSVSRKELAGSSEINPKNETRAVLTNPRRLFKVHRSNKTYIPNRAYTSLKQAPKTWDIFEYTMDGELDPSRRLSAEEVNHFLYNHPLHQGHRNLKESQLTLRVQRTPASSAKRFPNGLKCRLKDCPSKLHTINQGQLLIIVDELSVQHPDHDHFLNAFYLHLWCIERYLNFPEICSRLNVTAKGRNARLEKDRKNKFTLALGEEERVVDEFVQACGANSRRGIRENPWVTKVPEQIYDQQSLPYKGTLCHQLVITKLHHEGRGRINLRTHREDRAGYVGANIIRHLGDLSKEAEMREYSRTHRNQNQLKPNPKTVRYYRAEVEEDDSHSEPSHPQTHQPSTLVSPYEARWTKRDRDELDDGQSLNHDIVHAHKKPRLNIPERNVGQDVYKAGTPGISPCTPLTSQSRRTRSQLITVSPSHDARSASSNGAPSTVSEDESEGEIELEILAAQRRRRALEIRDAKDREKECKLRKLKFQKANRKKRAKDEDDDDGDETDSREKRQRMCYMRSG